MHAQQVLIKIYCSMFDVCCNLLGHFDMNYKGLISCIALSTLHCVLSIQVVSSILSGLQG